MTEKYMWKTSKASNLKIVITSEVSAEHPVKCLCILGGCCILCLSAHQLKAGTASAEPAGRALLYLCVVEREVMYST